MQNQISVICFCGFCSMYAFYEMGLLAPSREPSSFLKLSHFFCTKTLHVYLAQMLSRKNPSGEKLIILFARFVKFISQISVMFNFTVISLSSWFQKYYFSDFFIHFQRCQQQLQNMTYKIRFFFKRTKLVIIDMIKQCLSQA